MIGENTQLIGEAPEGALEGEVTMEDISTALGRTQPSTAAHEHQAYEQWDKEYGCK